MGRAVQSWTSELSDMDGIKNPSDFTQKLPCSIGFLDDGAVAGDIGFFGTIHAIPAGNDHVYFGVHLLNGPQNFFSREFRKRKVQDDEINRIRSKMLGYLRHKLKNDFIQLKTIINTDTRKMKPYTPAEKFMKLAEKNPAIRKLKDQLDLEIDF